MKYAIIKVVNGSYAIQEEGIASVEQAKKQYHGYCQTLWSASDVKEAYLMIVDEQLDCVEGYKEYIHHDSVEPTPEPTEE